MLASLLLCSSIGWFYLCNYDYYPDHPYSTELIGSQAASDFIDNVLPTFEDPNALNVYVYDRATDSRASLPYVDYNGVFMAQSMSPKTFAHEIGHFFGLLHTFEGTLSAPGGMTTVKITPSNSWNPATTIFNCHCCDCVSLDNGIPDCFQGGCLPEDVCDCNAYNSGDFIADTPPDPRTSTNICSNNQEGCPPLPCPIIDRNGQEWTYYTSYKNLMSYYWQCNEEFSGLQKDRMLQTLLVYPSRAHLINPSPNCEVFVSGKILHPHFDPLSNQYVYLPLPNADLDVFDDANVLLCETDRDSDGRYLLEACFPSVPDELTVIPAGPGQPTDGVTTADLVRITKHILGTEPLPVPYGVIAADANNSGSVTTFDIIKIRKLIIGITSELEAGSWRFLPTYSLAPQWGFKQPFYLDPFSVTWNYQNEARSYNTVPVYFDKADIDMTDNGDAVLENTWSFHSIKVGDANMSLELGFGGGNGSGFSPTYSLAQKKPGCMVAGERYVLKFVMRSTEEVLGYQVGLQWDPAELQASSVKNGNTYPFELDMFNISELSNGELLTSWNDVGGSSLAANQDHEIFQLQIQGAVNTCDLTSIIDVMTPSPMLQFGGQSTLQAEFYDVNGEITENVELSVELVPFEHVHKLEAVFPNPVSGQLSINYELGEPSTVQIQIVDQSGNELQSQQMMSAGQHTFSFPTTSNLQNGVLTYQIMLGSEIYVGNIVKL